MRASFRGDPARLKVLGPAVLLELHAFYQSNATVGRCLAAASGVLLESLRGTGLGRETCSMLHAQGYREPGSAGSQHLSVLESHLGAFSIVHAMLSVVAKTFTPVASDTGKALAAVVAAADLRNASLPPRPSTRSSPT